MPRLPLEPHPKPIGDKAVSAVLLITICLASSALAADKPAARVILPDSKLIGCKVSACSQVMPTGPADPHAAYPWQISVDIDEGTIIGLTVLYDPAVSIDAIQASIDERYGKWAIPDFKSGPLRMWRVEPDKFAIQLATNENGMTQLIYIAFGAKHPIPAGAHLLH